MPAPNIRVVRTSRVRRTPAVNWYAMSDAPGTAMNHANANAKGRSRNWSSHHSERTHAAISADTSNDRGVVGDTAANVHAHRRAHHCCQQALAHRARPGGACG